MLVEVVLPVVVAGVFATCVPANAKNLRTEFRDATEHLIVLLTGTYYDILALFSLKAEQDTYKVPTNSPAIAMK